MLLNKILKVVLLLLGGVFVLLQGFNFEVEGAAVSILMLLLLVILYYKWTENRVKYFVLFLVTFTLGHALSFTGLFGPELYEGDTDYVYYLANSLSIAAYLFLIIRVITELRFKEIFSELAIPIVILIVLDVFCVILVTDTAENSLTIYEYALEFIYNGVIMALLSVALINYMYRNDNKSMLMLLGSICIVFSEIIQLSYYYIIPDSSNLVFIYSFFLVVALVFFYLQSQLQFTGPEPAYTDEQLEEV